MGTDKAPMYAAGSTVWTNQDTPLWAAGSTTPTSTQNFRNTNMSVPVCAKYADWCQPLDEEAKRCYDHRLNSDIQYSKIQTKCGTCGKALKKGSLKKHEEIQHKIT